MIKGIFLWTLAGAVLNGLGKGLRKEPHNLNEHDMLVWVLWPWCLASALAHNLGEYWEDKYGKKK